MKGKVYDLENNKPLDGVEVLNVHSGKVFYTDSTGLFEMDVEKGQLVEFTLIGYDVSRVRIAGNQVAQYYNIAMKPGAITLEEVQIYDLGRGKWGSDSAKSAETYKQILEHYKLEGLDVIQHPFDAMSKTNRQIWAFQRHYDFFEKEKYIDYVFNEKIIKDLTGLGADSMTNFMRAYRPQYDMIRNSSTYEFYEYIQRSVANFRRHPAYRRED